MLMTSPLKTNSSDISFTANLQQGSFTLTRVGHLHQSRPDRWRWIQESTYLILHYVYAGQGIVEVDGKKISIAPGTWFVIYPGQSVKYTADINNPWRYYWAHFHSENSQRIFSQAGITEQTHTISEKRPSNVIRKFKRLLKLLPLLPPHRVLLARALGLEIIDCLINSGAKISRSRQTDNDDFVQEAKWFMEVHFRDHITAADVIAHIGFERSYFSKKFKQQTGQGVREYLDYVRMNRAKQLLKDTDLTLESIADNIGYSNQFSFARRFKQFFGTPPGEYRNHNKMD